MEENENSGLRPAGCRRHLRNRLADEFRMITENFVEEAKKGGPAAMRLVLEVLKPAARGKARSSPTALRTARRILEELQREDGAGDGADNCSPGAYVV